MDASLPPEDPGLQLRWLVDRARISDLLVAMARALDDRDGPAYAALFTEDGVLELGEMRIQGREALAAGVARNLGGYGAVWHLSSNHAIQIDGDRAWARSYVIGAHRHGDDLTEHADMAGWYDATVSRTADGWRFASLSAHVVWMAGSGPLPHD
jgi:uncharacterized protein (TIGR02246 family)